MIIEVLMILAFTLGPGTQSLESSTATADTNTTNFRIETNCWRNGIWYNPCPPDPDPPPPPPVDPLIIDQQ